jgi:predicted RNA-binding Zn-ribbon protein involved in translation (DUF1610 family)
MTIVADNLPLLRCLSCGNVMKLLRTVPRLGGLPELVVFVCPSCNEVETKEISRVAA